MAAVINKSRVVHVAKPRFCEMLVEVLIPKSIRTNHTAATRRRIFAGDFRKIPLRAAAADRVCQHHSMASSHSSGSIAPATRQTTHEHDTGAHQSASGGTAGFATGIGDFVRRRSGMLALSGGLSALGAALGLLPYLFIYLITLELFVAARPDTGLILTLAGASVGVALLRGLVMTASTHVSHTAAYDILYDARIEVARKLGTLSLDYFNANNTGAIKKVLHEDIEQMEEGIAHIIPDAVAGIVTPVLTLIVLLTVDWRMALATVASIVVAVTVYVLMLKSSMTGMTRYQELVSRMNAAVIQYINGMKVIKAFAQTGNSFERLRVSIQEMTDFYNAFQLVMSGRYAVVLTLVRATLLTILPAGVYLLLTGGISLQVFVLFALLGIGFNRPVFQAFIGLSYAGHQVSVAAGRLAKVLAEASLPEPTTLRKPERMDVSFDAVTFSYQADQSVEVQSIAPVLNKVSLNIPQGTVTALVGPSGAGKTTMARLIPRFWDVTSGAIRIGGVDTRDIGSEHLMSLVSFVFQDVFLFNDTVAENIRIGKPDASDDEVIAAARAARCHDFITQELSDGYATQVGENGSRLSGGQRQRISIARAILKDAPIVVLDEATAFVDPENESQIQAALSALMQAGKTMIIVAHRLHSIVGADQIAVVNEGRIEAHGRHEALLRECPLYHEMWDAHTQAGRWVFAGGSASSTPIAAAAAEIEPPSGQRTALVNPYVGLSESDSLPIAVRKLGAGESALLRRGVIAKIAEGVFVALPNVFLFLVLLQALSDQPDAGQMWLFTALTVMCFGLQFVLNRISLGALLTLDTRIQHNLRIFLADYMRRLPMGFFTRRDVGTIDALFTTHLQFLESRMALDLILIAIVTPTLVFINALFIDWRMALTMAAGLPVALLAIRAVDHVFARVWRAQSDARTKANAQIVEYIQGIPVLRAFNLTGGRRQNFQRALDAYRLASVRTTTQISPATAAYIAAVEISFAALIVIGAMLHGNSMLSAERFLLVMILATGFYAPLLAMGDFLGVQRIAQNAIRNINAFIKTPTLPEPTQPRTARGFEVVFDRVSFDYGLVAADSNTSTDKEPVSVLNDVSFTVPERSVCALVGPSGSGKTTIVNLIARFWDVGSGQICVGGVDVREQHSDDLLARVSMVMQDVYLFNDTVRNNIRIGRPTATDDEITAAAQAAQCHAFIMAMPEGYDSIIGEGGSTLSGGQKQRISIARAILKDAPIILLDEATASVDPENEQLIQRAFEALAARKTLIIIAHRLTTIQKADQILVINHGRIEARGRHTELLARGGLYSQFWREREMSQQWRAV
jgi:ATP-binding cassette, subfamily B, bacterial